MNASTSATRLGFCLANWLALAGCLLQVGLSQEKDLEFTIVVYNVENLFDLDRVSLFDDYASDRYGPDQFRTKLANITKVLGSINGGSGPEIVLFEEIEADQTNSATPFDHEAFLKRYSGKTVGDLLQGPISDELRDVPAYAFLIKSLHDAGMGKYHVAVGKYVPDPTRIVAHINVTLSKFPILESQTHLSPGARGTLEVVHSVAGKQLHTFNSHWKSGASEQESETIRIGNAQVVRQRLDELLAKNPLADIVLGGDFNSHYNQSQRFPAFATTALNTVLGSQGNELSLRENQGARLYNLWYEHPPERRGSDVYRDEWGTLMQMMLTPGLYDGKGIQYVDNSFRTVALEAVNCQVGSQVPIRWNFADQRGGGFSDHLPIQARFRVLAQEQADTWLELSNPGSEVGTTAEGRKVAYGNLDQQSIPKVTDLGSDAKIKDPNLIGHVFRVEGKVSGEMPFRIRIFEEDFSVWAFDIKIRREIYRRYSLGNSLAFFGELGIHEGRWQFVVRDLQWLEMN